MSFVTYKNLVQILSPAPLSQFDGAVAWQANMKSLADAIYDLQQNIGSSTELSLTASDTTDTLIWTFDSDSGDWVATTAGSNSGLTFNPQSQLTTFTGDVTVTGNIFVGDETGVVFYRNNSFVGGAGNTTAGGFDNTGVGPNALIQIDGGDNNTAVGQSSLASLLAGTYNTAVGALSLYHNVNTSNTAVGYQALFWNASGNSNTAIGFHAGFDASIRLTECQFLTLLGAGTNASSDGLTNSTALGAGAIITASNQIMLGNTSVTEVVTSGDVQAASFTTTADGTVTTTTLNVITIYEPDGYWAYGTDGLFFASGKAIRWSNDPTTWDNTWDTSISRSGTSQLTFGDGSEGYASLIAGPLSMVDENGTATLSKTTDNTNIYLGTSEGDIIGTEGGDQLGGLGVSAITDGFQIMSSTTTEANGGYGTLKLNTMAMQGVAPVISGGSFWLQFDEEFLGVWDTSGLWVYFDEDGIHSRADVVATGAVHAATFYGDGSNLSGLTVGGPDNIFLNTGSDIRFNGYGDSNWRIGIVSVLDTNTVGVGGSIQFISGAGSEEPDGLAFGNCNGISWFEIRGYDGYASFFGDVGIQYGHALTLKDQWNTIYCDGELNGVTVLGWTGVAIGSNSTPYQIVAGSDGDGAPLNTLLGRSLFGGATDDSTSTVQIAGNAYVTGEIKLSQITSSYSAIDVFCGWFMHGNNIQMNNNSGVDGGHIDMEGGDILNGGAIGANSITALTAVLSPNSYGTDQPLLYLKQYNNDYGYRFTMDNEDTGDLFLMGVNNGIESTMITFNRESLEVDFAGQLSAATLTLTYTDDTALTVSGPCVLSGGITFNNSDLDEVHQINFYTGGSIADNGAGAVWFNEGLVTIDSSGNFYVAGTSQLDDGSISTDGAGNITTGNLTAANIAGSGATLGSSVITSSGIADVAMTVQATGQTVSIALKELSSNVATLVTTGGTFSVGNVVVVSGVDGTFDGTYTVTGVPSGNSFTYDLTGSDVGFTSCSGTASVGQTANLQNWEDSSGDVLAFISVTGAASFAGGAASIDGIGNAVLNGNLTVNGGVINLPFVNGANFGVPPQIIADNFGDPDFTGISLMCVSAYALNWKNGVLRMAGPSGELWFSNADDLRLMRTDTSTLTLDDGSSGVANLIVTNQVSAASMSVTGQISQTVQTLTDGPFIEWDVTQGAIATVTLTDTNRTLRILNAVAGTVYVLQIVQDGTGGRTITTYGNVVFPNGVVPALSTAAGAIDMLTLVTYDGGTFFGAFQGNFS